MNRKFSPNTNLLEKHNKSQKEKSFVDEEGKMALDTLKTVWQMVSATERYTQSPISMGVAVWVYV